MTWRLRIMLALFRPFVLLYCLSLLAACSSNTGVLSSGTWQQAGLLRQHIRTLVVNSNNPNILYAGDMQGRVFLSTNAAQNWSERSVGLPLSTPLHKLVFNASVKRLYALTDKGIFVSSDTVARWSSLSSSGSMLPADNYTSLDFDASKPADLYVGTAHDGAFASVNGGVTWFAAKSGLPAGVAVNNIVFDAERHRLWAATSVGVFSSSDQGKSWQALRNGLPTDSVAYTVQTVSGTPNLVYLGTNRGFFSSQDAGARWTASKENLAATSIYQILVDFRDNSSGTTLYIGSSAGIFRSNDSGQNWISAGPGLPRSQPVYALAFGSDNYSQLYAAADDVYQFPGNSTGLSPLRFIAIVIIFFFLFTLYRMTLRNRRRGRVASTPGVQK